MRYDEMRQHVETHFRTALQKHKERLLSEGDGSGQRANTLRSSISLVEDDIWLELAAQPDEQGSDLLSQFKTRAGVGKLTAEQDELLLQEYRKGYRSFLALALEYNANLDQYDLTQPSHSTRQSTDAAHLQGADRQPDVVAYATTVHEYLTEGQRGALWAAKTISEKRDALKLLGVITNSKPTANLTKADARKVKDVVTRLPKNRNKDSRTRDLSLADMLDVKGVDKLSTRTVNVYLSAYQSFATWAVNNGHATTNVFTGTRLANKTRDKTDQRDAFTPAQLRLLFRHLTVNPDNLVRKDDHKWPTLIAMFTGARLNEVAQLHIRNIQQLDGIWCIDINDDAGKSLKNASSRRQIPVHQALLKAGFIEFVEKRKTGVAVRLFPDLSYSTQNGYGRNVGTWFNQTLLPTLALKQKTLVFHSLRHSMTTLLSRADVPDIMVKAILGHTQVGVTHTSYFKSGFTAEQLKREIDKFDFRDTE
ncbi:Phage integrase family protein [Roseovarius lutimaris]|uniref:Phage integrase family protein n=1 Tax=Roseovarius lutimaris TaxID=1005928 RepID=A0A1I5A9A5_9RHOB|nr:site-specific integrase [Roseovarius lutimaris]SFN58910.1 Phage integrase family protein [Roseovarius lutimaris]